MLSTIYIKVNTYTKFYPQFLKVLIFFLVFISDGQPTREIRNYFPKFYLDLLWKMKKTERHINIKKNETKSANNNSFKKLSFIEKLWNTISETI